MKLSEIVTIAQRLLDRLDSFYRADDLMRKTWCMHFVEREVVESIISRDDCIDGQSFYALVSAWMRHRGEERFPEEYALLLRLRLLNCIRQLPELEPSGHGTVDVNLPPAASLIWAISCFWQVSRSSTIADEVRSYMERTFQSFDP